MEILGIPFQYKSSLCVKNALKNSAVRSEFRLIYSPTSMATFTKLKTTVLILYFSFMFQNRREDGGSQAASIDHEHPGVVSMWFKG